MVGVKQLALLLGALLPVYGAPTTKRGAAVVEGKYIVTLKKDLVAPQVDSHMSWVSDVHSRSLARRQTSGVDKIWTTSFKGYSGEFDEATLEEIKASDEVCLLRNLF
jgi:oryzin